MVPQHCKRLSSTLRTPPASSAPFSSTPIASRSPIGKASTVYLYVMIEPRKGRKLRRSPRKRKLADNTRSRKTNEDGSAVQRQAGAEHGQRVKSRRQLPTVDIDKPMPVVASSLGEGGGTDDVSSTCLPAGSKIRWATSLSYGGWLTRDKVVHNHYGRVSDALSQILTSD